MTKGSGVRNFPIILFASVMGFAGVTISFQLAENLYGFNNLLSTIMLIFTLILFVINGSILILRLVKYYSDVRKELDHPVQMNFYGTISISFLLLSVIFLDINSMTSQISWLIGAIIQLGLTLFILSNIIWNLSFELSQFNPTWFIPIVGNIVVPLAGIYHASTMINWIFFSIGILFAIVYFVIFIKRIFFQPGLPPMLTPAYFIVLAPFGIGFISYVQLMEKIDAIAYILFGVVFYLGLLFIFQWKRFIKIPFFISWWAYLFPSAAATNATIHLYMNTNEGFISWLIPIQLIGLLVLSIYLLIKTTIIQVKLTRS